MFRNMEHLTVFKLVEDSQKVRFLLHLGYDNAELKAVTIDHPEYGSLWRQLDYDVFNSKEIKQLLKDEGIKLVNWGEIREIIYGN